jgi:hypothetical protein
MIVVDPDDRLPFVLAPEPGRREWDGGGVWIEIEELARAAGHRAPAESQ